MRTPLAARIDNKSDKGAPNGCWLWTGVTNARGTVPRSHVYGLMKIRLDEPNGPRYRWALAHRVSFETHVGPIPEGYVIDHLCRVTLCVNPSHLQPVPQRINAIRGVGWPGQNARKTHCKHGHEFTPENTRTRITSYGTASRVCKACARSRYGPFAAPPQELAAPERAA